MTHTSINIKGKITHAYNNISGENPQDICRSFIRRTLLCTREDSKQLIVRWQKIIFLNYMFRGFKTAFGSLHYLCLYNCFSDVFFYAIGLFFKSCLYFCLHFYTLQFQTKILYSIYIYNIFYILYFWNRICISLRSRLKQPQQEFCA